VNQDRDTVIKRVEELLGRTLSEKELVDVEVELDRLRTNITLGAYTQAPCVTINDLILTVRELKASIDDLTQNHQYEITRVTENLPADDPNYPKVNRHSQEMRIKALEDELKCANETRKQLEANVINGIRNTEKVERQRDALSKTVARLEYDYARSQEQASAANKTANILQGLLNDANVRNTELELLLANVRGLLEGHDGEVSEETSNS